MPPFGRLYGMRVLCDTSLASESRFEWRHEGITYVARNIGGNGEDRSASRCAADRFGPRKVIALSLVAACPFLFIAPFLTGLPFVVVLAFGGLFLQSTLPVNVTFGQALAPVSAATVSSLMMGFAWGAAGLIFIPLTGWLSDLFSMQHAFEGLIVFPLIGFLLALNLPKRCAQSAS